jgi:hypothetical protein
VADVAAGPTGFIDSLRKTLGLPDRRLRAAREFVRDAYRAILKRDADEAGLAAHTAALLSGTVTRQRLLEVLADSDEHLLGQAKQFLGDAYLAILQRDADEAGLATYTNALLDGTISRRGVLEALANSKEHYLQVLNAGAELEGPQLDEARRFVRDAFLGILQREADDAGLATYTNALLSGAMSRQGVLEALAGSREHLQQFMQLAMQDKGALSPFMLFKLRDSLDGRIAFVQDAYRGVLGREPGILEIETHANALAATLTRSNFLAALVAGAEFATKSSARSSAVGSLAALARDLLGPLLPRGSTAGGVMAAGIADIEASLSAEVGETVESVRRASEVARFLERRREDS